jgi:hypothetical protein
VVRRRAAALGAFALLAAGCGSQVSAHRARLPVRGPNGVVRIALADLLWPLDPARARGRDELALARVLFATPLRTDPETGALRPGLCSDWTVSADRLTWRLRCSHAGAIAAELRRTKLAAKAPDEHRLVVRLKEPDPRLAYRLTEIAAAPPGVPGPFHVVSASPTRIVAENGDLRLEFRKLEPHAALRLIRRGLLDEAPVPLGDLRALQRDPELRSLVRVRRLLAADVLVFEPHGSLAHLPELRRVYDDTADRADYQALVPEFEARPAENLVDTSQPSARRAVLKARRARAEISSLPRVAVHIAVPRNPDLAYGAALLVAAWRDIGLGPVLDNGPPDARFERLLAPYPRLDALGAVARGEVVPVAWAVDARLVSPRLRGWREGDLGAVDYTHVRAR